MSTIPTAVDGSTLIDQDYLNSIKSSVEALESGSSPAGSLNIDGLAAIGEAVDLTNDTVPIYNASGALIRKVAVGSLGLAHAFSVSNVAELTRTTDQALAHWQPPYGVAETNKVSWTETQDGLGIFAGGSADRITIVQAGWYRMSATITVAHTNFVRAGFFLNTDLWGGGLVALRNVEVGSSVSSPFTTLFLDLPFVEFDAADVVRVLVIVGSVGTLTCSEDPAKWFIEKLS